MDQKSNLIQDNNNNLNFKNTFILTVIFKQAKRKTGHQSGRRIALLIYPKRKSPAARKLEATLFRFSCYGQFAEIFTDNLLRQLSRRMIHATYSPLPFLFYQIQQRLADLPNPVSQPNDQPVLFQSPEHSGDRCLGMPGVPNNPILAAQKQVGRLVQMIQDVLYHPDFAGQLQLGQLCQFLAAFFAKAGFLPGALVRLIFVCGRGFLCTKTFDFHSNHPLPKISLRQGKGLSPS